MQVINHIEVRDNTAYITGHNIKAKMLARLYVWEKASIEELTQHYNITPAQAHAAIAYYYDNQAVLDAEYEENVAQIKSTGTSLADFKAKIEARKQKS